MKHHDYEVEFIITIRESKALNGQQIYHDSNRNFVAS